MKKLFISIAVVLVVAVAAALIWLSTLDGNYDVKRTITVHKSTSDVFELVQDFNKWTTWSPWLCMEPDAKVEVSGTGREVNDNYTWEGKIVGSGIISHTKIVPLDSLLQEIKFIKPFESTSTVYWNFKTINDSSTSVTWGMRGEMPFLLRFMTKMIEPMVGMDYERGLKMIKDYAEKGYVASEVSIDGIVETSSFKFIGKKTACEMKEVGTSMSADFSDIREWADSKNIEYKTALSIYHKFDFITGECEYTAALPVQTDVSIGENYYEGEIPIVKALKITFKGDYEHLGNAWAAGMSYMQTNKLEENNEVAPFEVYITDPQKEADERNWVTEVYMPIK